MYAIVRAGGRQERVTKGERLKIDSIEGDVGAEIKLGDVLFVGGDESPKIGQPLVEGAVVTGKIVAQDRGPKLRVFKKQRRLGYHKTIGHRQQYTEIEIIGIEG